MQLTNDPKIIISSWIKYRTKQEQWGDKHGIVRGRVSEPANLLANIVRNTLWTECRRAYQKEQSKWA